MKLNENSPKPIFYQIAEIIEDNILKGELKEEEQVYSTNQLAEIFKINPATARKGLTLLVEEDILYKKRGLGMYVKEKAVNKIKKKRKREFFNEYLLKTLIEAKKIDISKEELIMMINEYKEAEI